MRLRKMPSIRKLGATALVLVVLAGSVAALALVLNQLA
jgi:hypothetical protein